MPVTLICTSCGEPFKVKPSQAQRRKTCSPACRDTRCEVSCDHCGIKIMRPAWHRNAGYKHTFCSTSCHDAHTVANREGCYTVNFAALDNWTDDLGYFLGLFSADGNVRDIGQCGFVGLDECLTVFVRDFIAPDSPVRTEKTKQGRTAYRWTIHSKQLVANLAKFGIIPRKSRTMTWGDFLPDDNITYSFIRGYLDGDGTVDNAARFIFSTGSQAFSTGLCGTLNRLGHKTKTYQSKTVYNVTVSVPGSRTLAPLLYASGFCLPRKRDKYFRVARL